ncbi:unnamed protein product [Phytophthora lilii]|uniref:Unnamed protein product n=1 Tax=Phytophthora lilii TaxID=2077276 RepID=A0A9W6TEZ4_9STRA|nr:unnamed protein product [Phytophthora lilii]
MKVGYVALVAAALLATLPTSSGAQVAIAREHAATTETKLVHLRRALLETATSDASDDDDDEEEEESEDSDSVAEEEEEFDESEKEEDKKTQAPTEDTIGR